MREYYESLEAYRPGNPSAWLTAQVGRFHDWRYIGQLYIDYAPHVNHVVLSCMLTRVSKLLQGNSQSKAGERARAQPFWNSLLAASMETLESHGTQELVNNMAAVARLDYQCADYAERALHALSGRLDQLLPLQLASLMWALGKLELQIDDAELQQLLCLCGQHLPDFNAAELALTLHGLCKLHVPLGFQWWHNYWPALDTCGASLSPQHMVMVLTACTEMGVVPPEAVLLMLVDRAEEQLPDGDARAIATLCWGLARCDHQPPTPWVSLALTCILSNSHKLCALSSLTNMMWALANWGHRPDHKQLRSICRLATRLLASCRPTELSILMHSLARLSYWPGRQWVATALHTYHQQLTQARTADSCRVLWAVPRLLRPLHSTQQQIGDRNGTVSSIATGMQQEQLQASYSAVFVLSQGQSPLQQQKRGRKHWQSGSRQSPEHEQQQTSTSEAVQQLSRRWYQPQQKHTHTKSAQPSNHNQQQQQWQQETITSVAAQQLPQQQYRQLQKHICTESGQQPSDQHQHHRQQQQQERTFHPPHSTPTFHQLPRSLRLPSDFTSGRPAAQLLDIAMSMATHLHELSSSQLLDALQGVAALGLQPGAQWLALHKLGVARLREEELTVYQFNAMEQAYVEIEQGQAGMGVGEPEG